MVDSSGVGGRNTAVRGKSNVIISMTSSMTRSGRCLRHRTAGRPVVGNSADDRLLSGRTGVLSEKRTASFSTASLRTLVER